MREEKEGERYATVSSKQPDGSFFLSEQMRPKYFLDYFRVYTVLEQIED